MNSAIWISTDVEIKTNNKSSFAGDGNGAVGETQTQIVVREDPEDIRNDGYFDWSLIGSPRTPRYGLQLMLK